MELLQGERTAHLAFKLALNLAWSETPVCNVTKVTEKAQVILEYEE